MSVPTFDLLKGPEFAYPAGEALLHHMTGIAPGTNIVFSRDQEHDLTIVAPLDEPWVVDAEPGRVARMVQYGRPFEWLISSRSDEFPEDGGPAMVMFGLDALHMQLADAGTIEDVREGGISWYQGGGVQISVNNYLRTYLIPHLERVGLTWYDVGTIDDNAVFDLDFEGLTPLAFWVKLAEESGQEWYLSRDESSRKYLLNIVAQIGSGYADALAAESLNLFRLVRERTREELRSVIRPVGGVAPGSERRADIGFNAWRVTNVSGDDVTVAAHDGGAGPIAEDGQWAEVQRDGAVVWEAAFLEAADGTFWQIVDADPATQTFSLESGAESSFSVDDDVSIVRDEYGTLITEIPSPAALARFGRIAGPYEDSSVRGERNWAHNPAAARWDTAPAWFGGYKDGAEGSTSTPAIKLLPANTLVPEGSVFYYGLTTSGGTVVAAAHTDGDATTDGSGDVTLSLDVPVNLAGDVPIWLNSGPAYPPNQWEVVTGGPPAGYGITRYSPVEAFSGVARVNPGVLAMANKLSLDQVPSGARIAAGSLLEIDGDTGFRTILNDEDESGGGATILIMPARNTSIAQFTDVTITPPSVAPEAVSDYVPGLHWRPSTRVWVSLGSAVVRYIEGASTVRARVVLLIQNGGSGTESVSSANSPWIQIRRLDGGPTTVAEVRAIPSGGDAVDIAAGASQRWTIVADYPVPEGEEPELEVRISTLLKTAVTSAPVTWIEAAILSLTDDADVPSVDGFHAASLFRGGQATLASMSDWGGSYEIEYLDLAAITGTDPHVAGPEYGAFIRIRTEAPSLYDLLRIERVEFEYERPENPTLTLERRPEFLTRQLRRIGQDALYVRVDDETVIASTTPPRVSGVPRAGIVAVPDPDDTNPALIGPLP